MSYLFSVTGAITPCGPRKVRRTWVGTVVNVLVLLALAALTGWLWSCVKHGAGVSHRALPGGGLLAVMPVPEFDLGLEPWQGGMIIGLLVFFAVALLWIGSRLMRWHDDEAAVGWSAGEVEQNAPSAEDPLGAPYQGLDAADVKRILDAAVCECRRLNGLLEMAQQDLSVEDYGARLTGVQHGLKGIKLCLAQLSMRFDVKAQPGGKES